ncbi:MAG: hypothetical protein JWN15_2796, partial [Firmicutes bacterium]|nr:hypothetical protein [Bacillota bacterium]
MKLRSTLAILAAVCVLAAFGVKSHTPSPSLAGPVAAAAGGGPIASVAANPAKVPASLSELKVEHVDFVAVIPPIPQGPKVPRPLYGARPEDRPALEQLLRGLAAATPADPAGADAEHKRVEWLDIHLINGRRIMVRPAWTCHTEGNGMGCTTVKGKVVIAEGNSGTVVAAPELEAFLNEGRAKAMPPVEQLTVDAGAMTAGETATVKGDGWAGAQAYRLTLEGAGRKITLS